MEDDTEFFFCFENISRKNSMNYIDNSSANTGNFNLLPGSPQAISPLNDPSSNGNNNEDYNFFGDLTSNMNFQSIKPKTDSTFQILNKLNKFEDTYYNNIIILPSTDAKLHDMRILEKNLNLIENTLPGLVICLMFRNKNLPINEMTLFSIVLSRYNDLRKLNGSKYKVKVSNNFRVISIRSLSQHSILVVFSVRFQTAGCTRRKRQLTTS